MTEPKYGTPEWDVYVQAERAKLEVLHNGKVWDTSEVQEAFEVIGFMAPYVRVIRKSDRKEGYLTFQHSPRFYFDFR